MNDAQTGFRQLKNEPWKSSTSTRLMYLLIFTVISFVCCVMLSNSVVRWADQKFDMCRPLSCGSDAGYLLVYRTLLCVALFHLAMAVLTIGVQNSRDIVSGAQQGFWAFKVIILVGMVMLSIRVRLPPGVFIGIVKYAGLWGGFGFMVFAYLVMLESAYKYEDCLARNGQLVKVIVMGVLAMLCSGAIMWTRFERDADGTDSKSGSGGGNTDQGSKCVAKHSMMRLNTALYLIVLAMTLVAGFPDAHSRPCRNLLPGAVTLNFLAFLTHLISRSNVCGEFGDKNTWDGLTLILGLYLCFSTLLYLLVRRNDKHSPCSMSTGALGRFYRRIYLRGSGVTAGVGAHQVHGGGIMTGDVDRIKFRNCDDIFDEVDQLQYSWCVFHLVLCGAALFVMLTLTNLYYPKRSTKASWYELMAIPEHLTDARSSSSAASPLPADPHATPLLWMHVIASWVCAALYLWSLLETTTSTKQQSKAEQYSYSYNANDNNNTSDHCAV
ncbi:probable serine incorporator isoform X2 [Varroa destructor]|uniref:Serine incorporator n=1 Tax=Varroa destructor TaxID=109461 RepID=A0A7M7K7X0_VARDE|nr:probable serine incorporator isoform X2 [Varroa destructor]